MRSIITIGRQYGSGGREIGQKLAAHYGVKFYDSELLARAAKESGLCEEIVQQQDERPTSSFLYNLVMDTYSFGLGASTFTEMPISQKVFLAQFDTIKQIANEEKTCVIIGRCANLILDVSEFQNVLRVYVHASWDFRVEEAMQKMGGSQKDIEKFLRKDDKRKMEFCQRYTGKEWTDPSYYDMYLDSSVLGFDGVYEQIVKKYNAMRNR